MYSRHCEDVRRLKSSALKGLAQDWVCSSLSTCLVHAKPSNMPCLQLKHGKEKKERDRKKAEQGRARGQRGGGGEDRTLALL